MQSVLDLVDAQRRLASLTGCFLDHEEEKQALRLMEAQRPSRDCDSPPFWTIFLYEPQKPSITLVHRPLRSDVPRQLLHQADCSALVSGGRDGCLSKFWGI